MRYHPALVVFGWLVAWLVFKVHRLFVSLNSRLESNREEEAWPSDQDLGVWGLLPRENHY